MLHMKLWGLSISAVVLGCIIMTADNFVYAEKDKKEHAEETTGRELSTLELPMCPTCKNVPLGPQKGKTLAPMAMSCPDCKHEITELAIHHCDKCGEDILVCEMCKAAAAKPKTETMEGKCPKCKTVRAWPIKGRTFAKWEMKCPDCKKKSQEWLIQHCDTCNVDFLSCPICKKEQEKAKK